MSDLISRQDAIRKFTIGHDGKRIPETDIDNFPTQISFREVKKILRELPSAQPETTIMTVGKSKGGITLWYECKACGEPVDAKDIYCRNCGRRFEKEVQDE